MLALTLPLAPSVNHCYLTTKMGRRILTDEGRSYMEVAALTARNAAQLTGWQYQPKAPLALILRFFFERDNRDLDNAIKLTLDALAFGLGFNDRAVKELHAYAAVDKHQPRCEVVVQFQLVVWGIS